MVNMNNILNAITGADKSMRTDMAANAGLLDRKQFNQFVRQMELNSTILKDAAFKRMERMNEVISGAYIEGRVLQDGYQSDGTTNGNLEEAKIGFGKAELSAKKLRAKTHLEDDDLDDNIEGVTFQDTLLSMMGSRIGEDLEAMALFGDSTLDREDYPLFHTYDGWIKQSTTALKSNELGTNAQTRNFDVHEDGITAIFDAIIKAVPLRIRQSNLMKKFKFYVPFEVEDAYRNTQISRNTALGDRALTTDSPLVYKKWEVVYAPVLDAEDCRALDNTVTCVAGIPDLWRWGVYKDVKLEPERKADIERTNFYYRTRCDVGLHVFSSFISAKMKTSEAEVIQAEAKE